jgi:hypothetical protein
LTVGGRGLTKVERMVGGMEKRKAAKKEYPMAERKAVLTVGRKVEL